jgi:hypothetical protein
VTVGIIKEKMDENINVWLNYAYSALDDSNDDSSIEEVLLKIGKDVFSLPDDYLFQNLIEKLNTHFNCNLSEDCTNEIAELLLFHAISEECINRAYYLEGIMELDHETQLNLMNIIQNFKNSSNQSNSAEHISYIDDTIVNEVVKCEKCADLTNQIKQLRQDLKIRINPASLSMKTNQQL